MSNEAVVNIPIAKLKTFPGHPYKVTDDEEMLGNFSICLGIEIPIFRIVSSNAISSFAEVVPQISMASC